MSAVRRAGLLTAVVGCLGAFLIAGCASTSHSITGANGQVTKVSATSHPKTKFLLHAGLAYFAFHHFIWSSYKAGELKLSHPVKLAEAGAAAVFTYHEVKLAAEDVRSSPLLSKLFSPLTAVAAKLSSLKGEVLGGNFSAVPQIKNKLGSISGRASGLGAPIHAISSHIPGLP